MTRLQNAAWIIKHRPTSVKDVVGEDAKEVAQYLDRPKEMPNFLFASRTPGTGKTTLAKALANDLGADLLELNSSMDRSINLVRSTIKEFVTTMSSKDGVKKIVFLDEADGLLMPVQQALRNLMETYASNAMFILTCNYIEKIIEPLQNRCVVLPFGQPAREEVGLYLKRVCDLEGLKYSEEGIGKLVSIHYPSIRNMVNELQRIHTKNQSVDETFVQTKNDIAEHIWNLIADKKLFQAKHYLIQNGVEPKLFIEYCFELVFTDGLKTVQKLKLIKVLSDLDYRISVGGNKQLQTCAAFIDIYKVISIE